MKLTAEQVHRLAETIEFRAEGLLDEEGADQSACLSLAMEIAEVLEDDKHSVNMQFFPPTVLPDSELDGREFIVFTPYATRLAVWREPRVAFVTDWGLSISDPICWALLPKEEELRKESL